jgi:hypothetical protein
MFFPDKYLVSNTRRMRINYCKLPHKISVTSADFKPKFVPFSKNFIRIIIKNL